MRNSRFARHIEKVEQHVHTHERNLHHYAHVARYGWRVGSSASDDRLHASNTNMQHCPYRLCSQGLDQPLRF